MNDMRVFPRVSGGALFGRSSFLFNMTEVSEKLRKIFPAASWFKSSRTRMALASKPVLIPTRHVHIQQVSY